MMFQKHDDDRDLIVSVARLLGEDVEYIRQRGFHVLEIERDDDEPDVVDLAALTGGLDWDGDVDPRCYVPCDGHGRPRAA
ncbi:MAG: hypothetical protein ACKOYJ_09740 [Planctomycetia bacterium]